MDAQEEIVMVRPNTASYAGRASALASWSMLHEMREMQAIPAGEHTATVVVVEVVVHGQE